MDMSMSMTTSTSMSGMSMSGMAMPTSTSSTGPDTMMGMSSMAMTFFTSATTPLFSVTWTPTSTGQYTGTCIFLIVLAAIFRALIAARLWVNPALLSNKARGARAAAVTGTAGEKGRPRHPWRAKDAVVIGAMDVVVAGVGYLLMIAVMTMNAGYFMSVLAGIFLGSVVFGRFIAGSAVH